MRTFVTQNNGNVSQELAQEQELAQGQQLKLTSRQIAYMRLLEMPVEQLKTRIENELLDNAALEIDHERREAEMQEEGGAPTADADDFYSRDDRAEWSDAMRDYATEDDIPAYLLNTRSGGGNDGGKVEDANATTFREELMEQVSEAMVTDDDRVLMEYLVGSLDDDGMLKKSLYTIVDELEVYQNITTTAERLEELLKEIQQFDPPGIGARTLQECLLIQARRRHNDLLARIIERRWEQLTTNRWDDIQRSERISAADAEMVRQQLLRLNPRPGNAPSEAMGSGAEAVTPDFFVEVDDMGHATVSLNHAEVPPLRVSDTFRDTLQQFATGPEERLSRPQREALAYARVKIGAAQAFIDNIRGRQNTLLAVMQGIVNAQKEYFATGDEAALHPMTMKEMAERLGFDISTISRVCSSKWADTPYGVHQLRWYFTAPGGVVSDDGEQLEQARIKEAIRQRIANEDKRHPLTDDALAKALAADGFPVARRTVAKYREQIGMPVARLRQTRI